MTLWRKSMFELVEKHEVVLPFDLESDNLSNSQVCLITILRVSPAAKLQEPFFVLVANLHLCYNIRRGDIKLAQINIALSSIAEINRYYTLTEAKMITFLCGDFNATPSSGIFRLITQGTYDCRSNETDSLSGQKDSLIRIGKEKTLIPNLAASCVEILKKSAYLNPVEPRDVNSHSPHSNLLIDRNNRPSSTMVHANSKYIRRVQFPPQAS